MFQIHNHLVIFNNFSFQVIDKYVHPLNQFAMHKMHLCLILLEHIANLVIRLLELGTYLIDRLRCK